MPFSKSKEFVGILFAVAAYFSFSILDAFQKTAVINHSIFQLLFIKYIFTLLLSCSEAKRKKNYKFWQSNNVKLQVLRSFFSIIESGCFVLAFRYLSLADVHSVGSLTPVIIVALSALILKENVSPKTWIAIFVGFLGVLIILRPGLSIFDIKSLLPLMAAFFLGLYQVVTRKVSENDSTETSLFYTSLIGFIVMSILAFVYWQPLTLNSYFLFTGIGIFFSMGIYFQIIALSKARASIIQPFHYTLIFWAIILGYLVYDDLPNIPTIVGAIIIAASGIYVLRAGK
ncbi:MAG: DMT family transporter [Alphaproteobacteria bacterium]|nr:DMT family transporter [Alphaproteobacteria bacterium]